MVRKTWYGQSIILLILLFLACSALAVAPNASVWSHGTHGAAAPSGDYSLDLAVDHAAQTTLQVDNLGDGVAILEITASGDATAQTLSIPVGGHLTYELANLDGHPVGEVTLTLSSNQPITAAIAD